MKIELSCGHTLKHNIHQANKAYLRCTVCGERREVLYVVVNGERREAQPRPSSKRFNMSDLERREARRVLGDAVVAAAIRDGWDAATAMMDAADIYGDVRSEIVRRVDVALENERLRRH